MGKKCDALKVGERVAVVAHGCQDDSVEGLIPAFNAVKGSLAYSAQGSSAVAASMRDPNGPCKERARGSTLTVHGI